MIPTMRSIMDGVRAWRRRFGHPPRVPVEGATLATMAVGTSGYVANVDVDSDGQAFVRESEPVRWEPDYFSGGPAHFVERTAEDAYALTVRSRSHFAVSSEALATRMVPLAALHEAADLMHPHYQRVTVDRLQIWPSQPG